MLRALSPTALRCLAVLWFAVPAHADGPFGIEMGQDVESLDTCKPGSEFAKTCDSLPKPHPKFILYSVIFTPETGACGVVAVSSGIATGGNGFDLKDATDDIAKQVSISYGKSKFDDFISSASIWNEPRYWMMGNLKKDRFYAYLWAKKYGSSLKNNVETILLKANATHSDNGYISIRYEFSNFKKCQDAMNKKNASAF